LIHLSPKEQGEAFSEVLLPTKGSSLPRGNAIVLNPLPRNLTKQPRKIINQKRKDKVITIRRLFTYSSEESCKR
jgi:hypothetical protein